MPRPPKDDAERRTLWVKYRASRTEFDQIESRRAAAGLSRSDYARRMALEGAIIEREPLADRQLLRALGAIGNNLNQIARSANISGELDPPTAEMHREVLQRLTGVLEGLGA